MKTLLESLLTVLIISMLLVVIGCGVLQAYLAADNLQTLNNERTKYLNLQYNHAR